jgi:hypothetical protein
MNERIQKIAQQSGIGFLSSVPPSMLEKFAELLVRECAHLIDTREPRDEPAPHIYLLKAFGVEK